MVSNYRVFAVGGSGEFPFDMLRYDAAYPWRERESGKLSHHARGRRIVVLRTDNRRMPTIERWQSFGWEVIQVWNINESPWPEDLVAVGARDSV